MTLNDNITKLLIDFELNRSPTAAGQYNWVSEFGPRSCSSFLSYITGWLAALGWQAAVGITGELQHLYNDMVAIKAILTWF